MFPSELVAYNNHETLQDTVNSFIYRFFSQEKDRSVLWELERFDLTLKLTNHKDRSEEVTFKTLSEAKEAFEMVKQILQNDPGFELTSKFHTWILFRFSN